MRFLAAILTLAATAQAQQTIPLWPHTPPEQIQTTGPEADVTRPTDGLINGKRTSRLANVTNPTLTIYEPGPRQRTGVAALVFPGGGYQRLAFDGEGTATCQWLTSSGITCLLLKYRVPTQGHYPENYIPLEDAQQAMRLARLHAKDWRLDPNRIGVVGFSAGGNLAALLSTHPDDNHVMSSPAAPDVPRQNGQPIDARANFAIVVYPAYLGTPTDPKESAAAAALTFDPTYTPNQFTPPTFLIQAENDKSYGKNAPIYYQALAAAKVPAELHMYATGGHGFGIHPPGAPEEHWTDLADQWLATSASSPPTPPPPAPPPAIPAQVAPIQPAPSPAPSPRPPPPGAPPPLPALQTRTLTSTVPSTYKIICKKLKKNTLSTPQRPLKTRNHLKPNRLPARKR